MENEYYSCFKYYSKKKRRLSCFGRKINDTELEIFIEECDKKDFYIKLFAKTLYEFYLQHGENACYIDDDGNAKTSHPQIFTIPLGNQHPKNAFLSYLRDNYLKPFPIWKVVRYTYLDKKEMEQAFEIINSIV